MTPNCTTISCVIVQDPRHGCGRYSLIHKDIHLLPRRRTACPCAISYRHMERDSLIFLKHRLLLSFTWLQLLLTFLFLHSTCLTGDFTPSVLCNNCTKQKLGKKPTTQQNKTPPYFVSILVRFHYILINYKKRNSHQEIQFLFQVTKNGKFSRASLSLCR